VAITVLKPEHASENGHHTLPHIECLLNFMLSHFMNVSDILEILGQRND